MYSHFIFDIDGTLIDTESTGVLSLIDTVRELMGRDMPYEEGYSYFGAPSSRVGDMLGYSGPEDFGEVWERNYILRSDAIKPFPDIGNILKAIKMSGKQTGCVTSRSRYEFNKDPHLAKLLSYLDQSVCAEDSPGHKPSPEPLLKCIGMMGNPPVSDCLYIGDTMVDFLCAKNAGCAFALADWKGRGLQGMDPAYHLTASGEILDLL